MKSKNILIAAILLISLCSLAAQEGFDEIFSESDSDSGYDAEEGQQGTPSTEIEESTSRNFHLAGSVGAGITSYLNIEDIQEAKDVIEVNELSVNPEAEITLRFMAGDAEGVLGLELSPVIWIEDPGLSVSEMVSDLVDELYARFYFGIGYIDAGLMKLEWGNGDGVHVTDPVNPLDLSGGPVDDMVESKTARPMLRSNFYLGDQGLMELVYVPTYSPYTYAEEGRWAITETTGTVSYPSTNTLEYAQLALRAKGTIGPVDLGGIYYFGFFPEVAFQGVEFTGSDPTDPTHYTTHMDYNRAHLFGVEIGSAVGPVTFRLEAGYWMTYDFEGDDSSVFNHRLVYLPGADVTIPVINLLISLQLVGDYTFHADSLADTDVDKLSGYDSPSHNNMLVAGIELPLLKERIRLRLGGMYNFEAEGFVVMPKATFALNDSIGLTLSGLIVHGKEHDNSIYYAWRNNDSVTISLDYTF